MKRYFYVFLLLVSLLAMGCPGPEEVPTYYVSQEMLQYCWFPDGSYWIYELEGSPGVFDTVRYSNSSNKIVQGDFEDFKVETRGLSLTVNGRYSRHTIYATPTDANGQFVLSTLIESYSNTSVEQYDYLLFDHQRGTDTLGIYPSPFKTHLDSIQIAGVTYYNVIEVSVNPPQAADWTHDVVWAKDIGVVRRSMKDGSTWNLLRYHINR